MTNTRYPLSLLLVGLLAACGLLTDAATRIAGDIEAKAGRLPAREGAAVTIEATPSSGSECRGPYKAQFDAVGALIVWCMDAAGRTLSSHSTSYHARFVDTAATQIVDKPAGATLAITLERRNGRAVITAVQ